MTQWSFIKGMVLTVTLFVAMPACAAGTAAADWTNLKVDQIGSPVSMFVMLTVLSLIPFLFIAMTTFTRNIVVLSLVRQALGLQQTPPNMVLIVLAFFLTMFVMSPTLEKSYEAGIKPFMGSQMPLDQASHEAWTPMREFMVKQTRESDLALIHELAKAPMPTTIEELSPFRLIPAFMLSELKLAFQIGFVIFLPFLIIDLVVSSILMSLGMIMVPPVTISLPLKIMLFLMIDGWGLIAQVLVRSAG
ncbi:MAG: flagellar type III secretion system pore protein FliP [Fluviicoccus sp.]|uniref:flagellar type III secretion system pore protein FliP n=1 Tax=Fluviicoccus sp. TaxID=2003552 RepID=UPI002718F16A|nr:flagellar type III secretion system pore protein FliP [Fluviicoccus sp.]MDO8330496.1 flagellar type III secretion system pore protein FliP [Fluviicoccus sp.]